VLYLKPDVLLILDRLKMKADHVAELSARFQVFNEDNLGEAAVAGAGFSIKRPFAALQANCFTRDGIPTVVRRELDLPAEEGVFPYVATYSRRESAPMLLTVVAAAPGGESITGISAKSTQQGWQVRGTHRGLEIDVTVDIHKPALPFA
jgi:hypothetical protein